MLSLLCVRGCGCVCVRVRVRVQGDSKSLDDILMVDTRYILCIWKKISRFSAPRLKEWSPMG